MRGLAKAYGAVPVLDGVDFQVPRGSIFSLLGPNGAGKTTIVRILATLVRPDAGQVRITGHDVVGERRQVWRNISLTGQYAAVDELQTGAENLRMMARLCRLSRRQARSRADELLERFDLTAAGDRRVASYSGGMRRRLDLAASLVGRPSVIFLDEPTTGLDPQGRIEVWELIASLVAGGTTLLLTTQYLEEADRLADEIVVIDHGVVIAQGTADQLKADVGGERLELTVTSPDQLAAAAEVLAGVSEGSVSSDLRTRSVTVPVRGGATVLVEALRQLDAAGVVLDDVGLRRPTLDDVFLSLTGHAAEEAS